MTKMHAGEIVTVTSRHGKDIAYGVYPVHVRWLDRAYWRMMVRRRDQERARGAAQTAARRASRLS